MLLVKLHRGHHKQYVNILTTTNDNHLWFMFGFADTTQIHVDMYGHSLKKQVGTIRPARKDCAHRTMH